RRHVRALTAFVPLRPRAAPRRRNHHLCDGGLILHTRNAGVFPRLEAVVAVGQRHRAARTPAEVLVGNEATALVAPIPRLLLTHCWPPLLRDGRGGRTVGPPVLECCARKLG